jgi:hypothetical protein
MLMSWTPHLETLCGERCIAQAKITSRPISMIGLKTLFTEFRPPSEIRAVVVVGNILMSTVVVCGKIDCDDARAECVMGADETLFALCFVVEFI